MNEHATQLPVYPRNFLLGAATSAYQIEGGIENDWRDWELSYRINGQALQRCGKAIDHWQRYEEDFALLASLGCNAYRLSIEWSRICPRMGRFDDRAPLGRRDAASTLLIDAHQRLADCAHLVCAVHKQDDSLERKKICCRIRLALATV